MLESTPELLCQDGLVARRNVSVALFSHKQVRRVFFSMFRERNTLLPKCSPNGFPKNWAAVCYPDVERGQNRRRPASYWSPHLWMLSPYVIFRWNLGPTPMLLQEKVEFFNC